ncbi:signal peptidase II [Clostridium sp. CM028]|uniref:signal peptidase II n=1 Tax=unclassified Clostridium TaxID=2614128 RepID=UPI001C0C064A|nr:MULTISPECIES: signal peptidase II [unclassified Clostridium]MBU3091527.1 signal peptidase II [Clostridium sp. CF011]MBW9144209.1 signal peptidase II [Clostridium sp. CM027]MBW9147481.1 signal peptidase II [Clostridium sp. CM028]UVE41152.1 signal peptidase II [Clostridium sp. CM027]WAG70148.1 signal peptidase II [Clostridium sp. CF011]
MEALIIFLGLILDRLAKVWALSSLREKNGVVLIKDFFKFEYLENRGAAFGILQNKLILLALVTLLIISGMIYYIIKYKPKSKFLRISFAFIISGALGNLYDRVFYKYVVDFILIHYKEVYYFPTFNIADMLVVVGTAILAISIVKEEV